LTHNIVEILKEKITNKIRITTDEAATLFEHASDNDLATMATQVRNRFHEEGEATYIVMAIINYTNVCVAKCDYCAFFRLPHQSGTYLLSFEQLCERIDSLKTVGGKLVGFNGGFNPKLKIRDYATLFEKIRQRYGNEIEFYEMTVAEFMFACRNSRLKYQEGARILADSGTRWVTGGGAEILDDAFRRRHSPGKYTVNDYFDAQRTLLETGIGSTATMVIGFDETIQERFNHLDKLRQFQDSVEQALPSFLCWTYKPFNTDFGGAEISNREYLRWLAISRIFLDNFRNIRTSVLTQNEGALAGLGYGANDFDLPTEDEVTQKAGATIEQDFSKILEAARKAGFNTQLRAPFKPTNSAGIQLLRQRSNPASCYLSDHHRA
jgi:cyclic dehypoxanthinyl futalosine synthase